MPAVRPWSFRPECSGAPDMLSGAPALAATREGAGRSFGRTERIGTDDLVRPRPHRAGYGSINAVAGAVLAV